MHKLIYWALDLLFNGGMTDGIATWMQRMYLALYHFMVTDRGMMNTSMDIFAGIACALLIIFFLMDMVSQASKDMFSLEKLVIGVIKLFVGMAILLFLQDILTYLTKIGYYMYRLVLENFDSSTAGIDMTFQFGSSEIIYGFDETAIQDALQDEYGGIIKFVTNFDMILRCALPGLLALVARIAGLFIVTSNTLMVMVRGVFAPIAVVQCFEDGTRSAGIRYLKRFAAECCTGAVIIVILYACTELSGYLVTNSTVGNTMITAVTSSNLREVLSFKNIALTLMPQLAAIGGIIGASKLVNDIFGAQ